MRQLIKRTIVTGLATVAAGGLALSIAPGVAQAADNGQRTGPVQFWAENQGNCKVEFTIKNTTNVTSYTIDWQIDDEPLRDVDYADFKVGRTGGMHTTVNDAPRWPDDIATEGENTEQNRWMVSNRSVSTATYTKDLKNLSDSYNPPLPNPDAATHTVKYRMVLGPPGNNGEGGGEWIGNREWHTVTVTGCAGSGGGSLDGLFGSS
ncbi:MULTISPECIES: hypothetical protein [Gordonia]|nr:MULTISPECIES: hypothetical protein [Gordonia]MDH3009828.1 hypothetical protein [Gordonia alkanivorans]MDH3014270.1 hypothetical protein [Gordonia alkanivorans]MDH3018624.1 hypothetical protein [Gordonia alkanivorans]MDH3023374.1 hypothetical protein [Gordonia alkanivorans]MDH3041329.1 hypothetical protein [Gordonia alkanivorans]